jgi:hypothetical protein
MRENSKILVTAAGGKVRQHVITQLARVRGVPLGDRCGLLVCGRCCLLVGLPRSPVKVAGPWRQESQKNKLLQTMVGRHIGINEWPNPDCSRMTGYAEVIPVTATATLLPA